MKIFQTMRQLDHTSTKKAVLMLTDDPHLVDYRVTQDAQALAEAGYLVRLLTPSPTTENFRENRDGYEVLFVATVWQPSFALWLRLIRTREWKKAFALTVDAFQIKKDGATSLDAPRSLSKLASLTSKAIRLIFRKMGLWRAWEQATTLPKEVALFDAASGFTFQIVHVHDLPLLRMARLLAKNAGAHLIYDAHELFPRHVGLAPHMSIYWEEREREDIGAARFVITVNAFIAKLFRELYGREDIIVIHNTVPYRDLLGNRAECRKQFLDSLNLNGERPCILLHVGFLIAGRSFGAILAMLKLLPENFGVVFLGDGPARAGIERTTAELGLQERVTITGMLSRDDVARLSPGGDIGIAAFDNIGLNEYYGSPNRLGDYVMAGLPVLASDFPFLRDFLEKHDCGEVFPPGNSKAMANAVTNMFHNPQRFDQLRSNAREAAEKFNWDIEKLKLLDIYHALVEEKGTSCAPQ